MNWTAIANGLWQVHPYTAVIIGMVFFVPLCRLITFPIRYGGRIFMKLNRISGIWEEMVSPFRNTFGILYLAGAAAWQINLFMLSRMPEHIGCAAASVALIAIAFANSRWKKMSRLNLTDFAEKFPTMHPQEFFDHMLCSQAAIGHRLPEIPFRGIDPTSLDFSGSGKKSVSFGARAIGAWSTYRIARLLLLVDRTFGQKVLCEVAPALTAIWSTRVCQLIEARVSALGLERIPKSNALQIYVYTHKSFLDFVVAPLIPLAVALRDGRESRKLLPHFLMAMDHFRKNILLYRILGIGRAAEAIGMMFVRRDGGGAAERARAVAEDAAKKLVFEDFDLAVFPQGTRALPYPDAKTEHLDAGYYTVGPKDRIRADGKHLKKGVAFIATEAARMLIDAGSSQDIRIIPVAIKGTSLACPKGSTSIAAGIGISLEAGEPITLTPSSIGGITDDMISSFASALHDRIDFSLKTTAEVHAELERRFFRDIHGMLDPLRFDEIAVAMKPWRGDDYLVHAILDVIYTCHPDKRRPLLGELVHSILNFASRDEILAFKSKAVDSLQA